MSQVLQRVGEYHETNFIPSLASCMTPSDASNQHEGADVRLILILALISAAMPAAAVNKCKQPDGSIIYSDLPCPISTTEVGRPNLTNSATKQYGSRASTLDTSPLPPIDFGKDASTQLNRASAMISSILVDARACEWDLKVSKKMAPCVIFIKQMTEGREWSQATTKLAELASDHSFTASNQSTFNKAIREGDEVVKIKEFALIRIGQ